MLGLEAEGAVSIVNESVYSLQFSVQKVPGIKLHSGLGGEHFNFAAGFGIRNDGGGLQAWAFALENEIVIIAAGDRFQLVDTVADNGRLAEVERRSTDGGEFAGGNELIVHGGVSIGVDL